ncbi:hypothetical protein SCP_0405910 [Sparassis crispa]|uniref:Uncharacterized protein n=1 Tax=Sparassis crispa TaxID=139825 RepID=A0A401GJ66_9APHY|nr:hypothetical protein SCP_0405910 [Sparassis crispa]GBE82208.1 hypothetical protein SCP_0405910 [Sparassis crispa]
MQTPTPPPAVATAPLFRELEERTANHRVHCDEHTVNTVASAVHAIRKCTEELAYQDTLKAENRKVKEEFRDLFPDDIPHLDELPTNVYHQFLLKDPNMFIQHRQYDCPKKYRKAWKQLLDGHLRTGHMRPSDSPYALPAFLIPKSDPTALPRWVNDYHALNANMVPDMHPLPLISDILADCTKGKI